MKILDSILNFLGKSDFLTYNIVWLKIICTLFTISLIEENRGAFLIIDRRRLTIFVKRLSIIKAAHHNLDRQ